MSCADCKPWYATTEVQLAMRLRNLQIGGSPYPCPKCGSVDWATSREMIGEATPEPKRSWRAWIDTPRWRALAVWQLITAVALFGCALVADTKWIVIVDAVGAGINLGLAYHAWRMLQVHSIIEKMRQAFESMCDINKGLVEADVGTLVMRIAELSDEDAPSMPIAPNKLH